MFSTLYATSIIYDVNKKIEIANLAKIGYETEVILFLQVLF